ncbi:hypothetical protein O9992_24290 [Vibrio lentus]|nr:hypothetical protein [Vibrio lentus]
MLEFLFYFCVSVVSLSSEPHCFAALERLEESTHQQGWWQSPTKTGPVYPQSATVKIKSLRKNKQDQGFEHTKKQTIDITHLFRHTITVL